MACATRAMACGVGCGVRGAGREDVRRALGGRVEGVRRGEERWGRKTQQLAVFVLRERWRRSSVGESTTDIITARMTAEKVGSSIRPSRRAVVAVMKANSPHADMARPTVITSFLRSGTTHRPVASLPG